MTDSTRIGGVPLAELQRADGWTANTSTRGFSKTQMKLIFDAVRTGQVCVVTWVTARTDDGITKLIKDGVIGRVKKDEQTFTFTCDGVQLEFPGRAEVGIPFELTVYNHDNDNRSQKDSQFSRRTNDFSVSTYPKLDPSDENSVIANCEFAPIGEEMLVKAYQAHIGAKRPIATIPGLQLRVTRLAEVAHVANRIDAILRELSESGDSADADAAHDEIMHLLTTHVSSLLSDMTSHVEVVIRGGGYRVEEKLIQERLSTEVQLPGQAAVRQIKILGGKCTRCGQNNHDKDHCYQDASTVGQASSRQGRGGGGKNSRGGRGGNDRKNGTAGKN
jgi:uncharacterized OB-fold protein